MIRTTCPHCRSKLEPSQRIHTDCVEPWANARMRAVLMDAVTWGHSEKEIRSLVKDGPWLEERSNKRKR